MRNSRMTWEGAFHHVMSRGHEGRLLFRDVSLKTVKRCKFGEILGGERFLERIEKRCDRRSRSDAVKRKRKDDYYFEPLAKVIQEFERANGVKADDLDVGTLEGKRLRGALLMDIREQCGLKYSEIIELALFSDIQLGSLGSLYWHTKKHIKGKP